MKRPNILFVITDQQRWDSLGCNGNRRARTPNIDSIAARGISFDRYYCASPICTPSRISIFSGMYPSNHGVFTNGLEPSGERPTLAAYLAERGFQTASIGKIHFTPYGADAGNMESARLWEREPALADSWTGPYWGFDHVEMTIGHTRPLAHYGKWFLENGGEPDTLRVNRPDDLPEAAAQTGTTRVPAHLHSSSYVGERASEWLKRRDPTRPFFLVASFPDPHHPFDPPAEVAREFDPTHSQSPTGDATDLATRPPHYRSHFEGAWHRGGTDVPAHPDGVDEQTTRHRIAYTDAMVHLIDRNVGRILRQLEVEGERENTIVLFTTDHGELLGDHGLWYKGPFFYESLVRLPLIVSVPGQPEGRSDELVSAVDIVPSLCELVGLEKPAWVDGRSAAALMRGDRKPVRDECLIEYRTGYERSSEISARVLVTRNEKYVRYRDGEEELTDLVADPNETINVAANASAARLSSLRDRLFTAAGQNEPRWPAQITHA